MSAGGRTAAEISVGDGRNVAFFGYRIGHAAPDEDVATQLRRVYGDLGWVIPEAMDGLERADSVYFDAISQVVAPTWSRDRVVLLGDAAWCVTWFAGYRSALAVGGADRLGTELERHPDSRTPASHTPTLLRRSLDMWTQAAIRRQHRPDRYSCRSGRGGPRPSGAVGCRSG
jgi:2-polyprenyl-6-methoxyphenol hydroxylase-like FAD-dependent oxidoreductase